MGVVCAESLGQAPPASSLHSHRLPTAKGVPVWRVGRQETSRILHLAGRNAPGQNPTEADQQASAEGSPGIPGVTIRAVECTARFFIHEAD